MEYKFIVTGGGTSGHINPAITIADALRHYYMSKGDSCKIIFTGRKEGLEGELVPKAGYEMKFIEAKPFPMKPGLKMIRAAKALSRGKAQCASIIDEFKPDAVIGTGGYVCAPLLMTAQKKGIPTIIHEANAFPGRANKMLGRKAKLVLTGFPDQEAIFKGAGKVVCSGNPIRSQIIGCTAEKGRDALGISPDCKLVFAMGGSLGAKTINDFILDAASDPDFADVKFVLSSGKQQSDKLSVDKIPDNLEIMTYTDHPEYYLAGADVCITRAGAVTCAETAAIGSCSVFVPYPHAAHDHQTYNASAFEKVGGCILMSDADVADGKLKSRLRELLDNGEERKAIREKAKTLAVLDCDKRICETIDGILVKNE